MLRSEKSYENTLKKFARSTSNKIDPVRLHGRYISCECFLKLSD